MAEWWTAIDGNAGDPPLIFDRTAVVGKIRNPQFAFQNRR